MTTTSPKTSMNCVTRLRDELTHLRGDGGRDGLTDRLTAPERRRLEATSSALAHPHQVPPLAAATARRGPPG